MIVLSTRQRDCWSICLPCSFSLVILLATSCRPSLSTPSNHCTKLGSNCRIPDPLNVALAKLLPQSHSRAQLCQNAEILASKTSTPAVPHSSRPCQVTSVLIERGLLVLSQSHSAAVDVRIYYANWMTAREVF